MTTGAEPADRSPWAWRGPLVAWMGLAAGLRVLALDKPLYIDEIVSVTVASQPLGRMADVMRQIDASPALSPLLFHFWLLAWNTDAWARLLTAMLGTATVWVVYRIGGEAFSRRAGLCAAFAAAIAPALVHYSQYIRNYALFTLLVALYLWSALRWLRRGTDRQPPGAWLVAGLVAALIYAHYLAPLFIAVPAAAVCLARRRERRTLARWVLAHVLGVALFAPGVPLLMHNLDADRVRNADRPLPPPATVVVPNLVAELSVGQRALGFDDPRIRRGVLAGAALVFPLLVVIGTRKGLGDDRPATVMLALATIAPIAIYVLSGRRLIAVRFFLPCLIGYFVLIGRAMASWPPRKAWLPALVLALLSAVPLWHFYTSFQWSYDHRAVARAIRAAAKPGDVLLVVQPYEAFYYRRYLAEAIPIRGLVFTALEDQPGYVIKPPPLDATAALARVDDAARQHARFWLIGQSPRSFPSDAREQARLVERIEATYRRLDTLDALTGADPIVRVYRGLAP